MTSHGANGPESSTTGGGTHGHQGVQFTKGALISALITKHIDHI